MPLLPTAAAALAGNASTSAVATSNNQLGQIVIQVQADQAGRALFSQEGLFSLLTEWQCDADKGRLGPRGM